VIAIAGPLSRVNGGHSRIRGQGKEVGPAASAAGLLTGPGRVPGRFVKLFCSCPVDRYLLHGTATEHLGYVASV
jgi:hypothetical protein